MGLTLTSQIKTALARVRTYVATHIQELASTTADLFEEVDQMKANKPLAVSVTIPTTGWQTDSTEGAVYPQYYDIPVEGVTSKDIPQVCIARASEAAANACGMSRTCETVTGAIRLWAGSVPTTAILAEYVIEERQPVHRHLCDAGRCDGLRRLESGAGEDRVLI